jgi:hypothetical protein
MGILNFIASIVGSLAWPSFALAMVLFLRKPLRDLIPLLQRLKYKDLEVEFGRRVEEVRAELPQTVRQVLPGPEMGAIAKLAEISPRSAVLESWLNVEQTALETANRFGANLGPSQTYQAIKFLERSDKMDRSLVSLLRDLRGLRNQAAHTPDFALGKAAALQYAESAYDLSHYFRNVSDT